MKIGDNVFGQDENGKDIYEGENTCFLCEKGNMDKMESSNKKKKLVFGKDTVKNTYYVGAFGEDILMQDIGYCPICGRKLV